MALGADKGHGTIGHQLGGCLWSLMCVAVFLGLNTGLVWYFSNWIRWLITEPDVAVSPVLYGVGGLGLLIYQGITVAWIVYASRKMNKPREGEG